VSDTTYSDLPVITHTEATSLCQLACPFCPREESFAQRGFAGTRLNPEALGRWIRRGDYAATPYTELQMSGEPLLHPGLESLIDVLSKAGIMVGFSTNGLLLKDKLHLLPKVTLLTVSVDSLGAAEYGRLRPRRSGEPGDLSVLLDGLDSMFALARWHRPRLVDIQMVAMAGDLNTHEKLAALQERFPYPGVSFHVSWDTRSVQRSGRPLHAAAAEVMCTDPWDIVVVHCDGTVSSCNTSWGRESLNTYGNLYENSLQSIWNGPKVVAMRNAQRRGMPGGACATCYSRNARRIHRQLIPLMVKDLLTGER